MPGLGRTDAMIQQIQIQRGGSLKRLDRRALPPEQPRRPDVQADAPEDQHASRVTQRWLDDARDLSEGVALTSEYRKEIPLMTAQMVVGCRHSPRIIPRTPSSSLGVALRY